MEIKKEIVLDKLQNGMAQSCHLGFEEIRGLDIFTVPGEATVNYNLANVSISTSSGIDSSPKQILNNITLPTIGNADYVLTTDLDIWSGSTLAEVKATTAKYLAVWKGHLMYSMSSGSYLGGYNGATFYEDKISTTSADFLLASLDDSLYISSSGTVKGRVSKLEEVAGDTFDINDSASYKYTADALTLPAEMDIVCMCDLGTYIAIACNSIYDNNKAYVYLWDGEDIAASQRIIINGGNINAMIAKNNRLYCQVGNKCEWFITDGTSVQPFAKMPESFMTYSGVFTVNRNAVDFNEKGNIIFGISQGTGAANGMVPNGIFELNTETGKIAFINTLSVGAGTVSNPVSIGCLKYDSLKTFRAGWISNGTVYGVDYISSSYRITGYGAYIVSPFYQIGSSVSDKVAKLKGFEIHLTKLLPTNCGIKMYYRTVQGGAWTQWGDAMTDTTRNIFWQTAGLDSIKNIQFKIEFTTPSNADATPTFLKAIIY
jgi:hypothetical protein